MHVAKRNVILLYFSKLQIQYTTNFYMNLFHIIDTYTVCNVTDDVGITTLKETGLLKSIIQGSSIEIHRKFKGSIWWKPNSQFILCCNDVPRINDTTPRND